MEGYESPFRSKAIRAVGAIAAAGAALCAADALGEYCIPELIETYREFSHEIARAKETIRYWASFPF